MPTRTGQGRKNNSAGRNVLVATCCLSLCYVVHFAQTIRKSAGNHWGHSSLLFFDGCGADRFRRYLLRRYRRNLRPGEVYAGLGIVKQGVFIERDGILNQVRVERQQQISPLTFEEFKVNE